MPKRCPKCKTLNSASALRCVNPDCDYAFSPDSVVMTPAAAAASAPQPAAIAAASPQGLSVAELQVHLAQRDHEIGEVRALVDRLEKELLERHKELGALAALPQSASGNAPGTPTATTTPAWMAKALGLVAAWPKVASAVTAVLALGAGYGGVASYQNLLSPGPAAAANAENRDKALSQRESDLTQRESDLSTRNTQLTAREASVKSREAELDTKDKTLRGRSADVTTRERSLKEEPRMGFFDFELPRGDGPIMLTRAVARGAWPSKDCVIVSVAPLERDEIPPSFGSLCRSDRIVLDRPKGPRRSVRVVWQLN